MKFSFVLTTVNTVAFGFLLISGGDSGIFPPAMANLPPLPDTKHNNEPADDFPAITMSSGGDLGREEPKEEVRIWI